MALQKLMELQNGVTVNYHRIVSINSITNHQTIIEIASYTSAEKRAEEKEKLAKNEPMNIFINTSYKCVDYDKDLNVDKAYDLLKNSKEFDDAQDI